jgi:hypothetical protein
MAAYAKCVRAVWAADADQRFTRASSRLLRPDKRSRHQLAAQQINCEVPETGVEEINGDLLEVDFPFPIRLNFGKPTKQPRKARSRNYSPAFPAFRRGFALSAPHDRIPVWATPLASQVLPRPSQPRRLLRGTLPSSAPLTGSRPYAFLLCSSAELKL